MTAENTPAPGTSARQGSIYDLGYQPYAGERLGWRYSLQVLWFYSLRQVFGIGRPLGSKAFPIGLALLAFVPAAIRLGIAAIAPLEIEVVRPDQYLGYISIILALFCAAVGPELMGRDQRTRTLALYFSRALTRQDYVTAKVAAMFTALLMVVWGPQALLLVGNAVATQDSLDYLSENAGDIPPVLASGLVAAVLLGSITLAISAQTSRRAFSTAAVIATFVVLTTLGGILVNTTSGDVRDYSVLISPIDVLDGATAWLFSVEPAGDSNVRLSDLSGWTYLLAAAVYSAAALAVLYRRYQRLPV